MLGKLSLCIEKFFFLRKQELIDFGRDLVKYLPNLGKSGFIYDVFHTGPIMVNLKDRHGFMINLIEKDIEVFSDEDDEEYLVKPILLSASFCNHTNQEYFYEISEKLILDDQPPSTVEITKLPSKG